MKFRVLYKKESTGVLVRGVFIFIFIVICTISKAQADFEVALTIDDLPSHGEQINPGDASATGFQMLQGLKDSGLQNIYGFFNAGKQTKLSETSDFVKAWLSQGFKLANHGLNHKVITTISQEEFISEITLNDLALSKIYKGPSTDYKYYRYPNLSEGETVEKRQNVRQVLKNLNYKLAPVTVYFSDQSWNSPYLRCLKKHDEANIQWLKKSYIQAAVMSTLFAQKQARAIMGRDVKQILLVHVGVFDSVMIGELIKNLSAVGVKFISLPQALQDEIYSIDTGYVSQSGLAYLDQLSKRFPIHLPVFGRPALPLLWLESICR